MRPAPPQSPGKPGKQERRRGRRRGADPAAGDITLSRGAASDEDAARALAYAARRFTAPSEGEPSSLQQGLDKEFRSTIARFGAWRRRVAEGRFTVVGQPIVSLADRQIHHYELLARFTPGKSPFEAVRFAEEAGLIEEFDLAICGKALAALAAAPRLALAVNLSGRSVQSAGFREALTALLRPHRALLSRLTFELTESHAVEHFRPAAEFLDELKSEGCPICLDDFGAGAATYHYLRHFAFDLVKIDGPFLKAAATNPRDRILVRSICALCAELEIGVIGEMIEDETAAAAAAELGISFGQGRLFGAPAPLSAA
ncbi:MAG TPA: EAL domain-containing protein [Stellaceae bacterium]|jgi:EAL domain-containing protein (putative c-di-GMP-specific phosphodiesterase class I)|nr:EAL domain-containing protein [Stellaceae bacterium]